MKNVIFLTCWALFAHILPLAAQTGKPEILQDTLVIKLEGKNQIHLTGASLTELKDYGRADSLKDLFFTDLKASFASQRFTEMPERLHYLVSADGKRRLKAEINTTEDEKFNLQHEKNRLLLDLPVNHFTIYDLKTNVQMHLYLQDSASVTVLENARIKPALQEMAQEDKKLKKFVKYTVQKQGDVYSTKSTEGNNIDMLSAEPLIGVALIGNQLSPIAGATLKITLHDKYTIPKYQFGINYFGYIVSAEPGDRFRDVNPGMMYDIFFGINTSRKQGVKQWWGVQTGLNKETRNNVLPKDAWKLGFYFNQGPFTYSFDVLRTNKSITYQEGNSLYMFSIKTSF